MAGNSESTLRYDHEEREQKKPLYQPQTQEAHFSRLPGRSLTDGHYGAKHSYIAAAHQNQVEYIETEYILLSSSNWQPQA